MKTRALLIVLLIPSVGLAQLGDPQWKRDADNRRQTEALQSIARDLSSLDRQFKMPSSSGPPPIKFDSTPDTTAITEYALRMKNFAIYYRQFAIQLQKQVLQLQRQVQGNLGTINRLRKDAERTQKLAGDPIPDADLPVYLGPGSVAPAAPTQKQIDQWKRDAEVLYKLSNYADDALLNKKEAAQVVENFLNGTNESVYEIKVTVVRKAR